MAPLIRLVLLAMPLSALAGGAHAEDIRIEVSKVDCQRIVRYMPEPDVAYKGGVDVHGRAVAPADLNSESRIQIPERIFMDLSIPFKDLLKKYNPNLENAEVYIGTVEYDLASGRLLFNGQELADPVENAIANECRKRYQ